MLKIRPTSNSFAVSDGPYGYSLDDERRYINLKALKLDRPVVKAGSDESVNDNGKRNAAGYGEARAGSSKKAKILPSTFKRLIDHTVHIQPYKKHSASNISLDELPESIDVDFSIERLPKSTVVQLKHGGTEFGRLKWASDLPCISSAVDLESQNKATIIASVTFVAGHYAAETWDDQVADDAVPRDFHLVLRFQVYIDMTRVSEVDAPAPNRSPIFRTSKRKSNHPELGGTDNSWRRLLRYALMQNPEDSPMARIANVSGLKYTKTNLDFFYACLRRPGTQSPLEESAADRKGKGRAVDQDAVVEEVLDIGGLRPTLHPFQRKSLKWLLRREGKRIAGRDEDGKHFIEDIDENDATLEDEKLVFWTRFTLEDYTAWLNVLTLQISETKPDIEAEEGGLEGSIIAEEMGLGKTVEVLALVLLNAEPDRRKEASYYSESLTCTIRPSGITLIVCPKAIVSQWQDEIERHSPTTRVLRYDGVKDKHGKAWAEDCKSVIKKFDIILCTFDVFTAEVTYARKPVIHNTRGKKGLRDEDKVNYTRSLLISIDFLRVVIDEAQMAASTTSAISELASLIPRKYSLAVSGTPIKQTIKDLAGLLKFLRIKHFGSNRGYFDWLISPDGALAFVKLISSIGIRTTKSQVAHELALPQQKRYIVPVEFAPVELFNYQQRYKDAVTALKAGLDINAVTENWRLDPPTMVSWLHLLRQACFHAQARQAQVAKKVTKAGQKLSEAQTLEEFGRHLRETNIAELHVSQRKAAENKIQRAYRIMYDKEDCERFETASKLLDGAKRDLKLLCQDIHNELLLILPEARGSRASSSSSTAGDMHFLEAFRETVKEAIDKAKENEEQDTAQVGRRATGLANRLREVAHVLHTAVFFTGNAYFAIGNKPDEEAGAYAEAERIRKQLLASTEAHASRLMAKMVERIKSKPMVENTLAIPTSGDTPGLQSGRVFDTIEAIADEAEVVAKLMLEWRKTVVEILSTKLADDEISAEEYQKNAEKQEQVNIYLEYLAVLQNDWIQLVTGAKSSLAANLALVEEKAEAEMQPAGNPLGGRSRRSLFKKKLGMTTGEAKAILAAADPAGALKIELGQARRKAIPSARLKEGISLSGQKRELSSLKERLIRPEEERIIDRELSRLRKLGKDVEVIIEQMRTETALFAEVYNARVSYFKQMQELSDGVAELEAKDATPFALQKAIQQFHKAEAEEERAVVGQISRRRFIDQQLGTGDAADNGRDDELCLICSDTEAGARVVTRCVHLFHWKCLRKWFEARFNRTCPVCRTTLDGNKAFTKLIDNKPLKSAIEGTNDAALPPELQKEPEAGPSSSKVEDPEESLVIDAMNIDGEDEPEPSADSKFNGLSAEEIELVSDVPLRGAALGSKLDFITKHVLHLRDKHARAMEAHDAADENVHSTAKAPTEAKILIYSSWQYACDVLAQALSRERIGYVRLETPGKGRKEQAVIEFKENPDVSVFILHAASQAAGLNLTAAQYVMLVEPLLQPALELQAIARVHRIGQTQDTTVFQYVIKDTVDKRIALLSLEKMNHKLFAKEQESVDKLLQRDESALDLGATAAVPTGLSRFKKGKNDVKSIDADFELLSSNEGLENLTRILFTAEERKNVYRLEAKATELRAERLAEEARLEELERLEQEEMDRALDESARLAEQVSKSGRMRNYDSDSETESESAYVVASRSR